MRTTAYFARVFPRSMPSACSAATATPAMRQYLDAKQQHRDAILFFRMGDFYEMFYEDALVAARALELTLTSRSKDANGGGIPMCGVPFHAVDGYIARLVQEGLPRRDLRAGRGSEEGQGPRQARSRARRLAGHADRRQLSRRARAGVPDGDRAAPTAAGAPAIGVALLDLSTGEFTAAEYAGADGLQALADELAVLRPREIVVAGRRSTTPAALPASRRAARRCRSRRSRLDVRAESARRTLLDQLRAGGLEGFGLDGHPAAVCRRRRAGPLPARHPEGRSRARARDRATGSAPTALLDRSDDAQAPRDRRRARTAAATGSLLDELDRTVTSMGSRLLRAWLLRPLVALEPIRDRLDAVEELAFRTTERGKFRDDAQGGAGSRAAGRARRARHRRPARSRRPAAVARRRCRACGRCSSELQAPLVRIARSPSSTISPTCATRSSATLIDEPPALARDGGFVRDGVDAELDELRTHQPLRQAGHRRDGRGASARAPASRR